MRNAGIYTVWDKRSETCGPIQIANEVDIVRAIKMQVNREDIGNNLYNFTEDYQLLKLGEIDTITGAVAPKREFLAELETFKHKENDNGETHGTARPARRTGSAN